MTSPHPVTDQAQAWMALGVQSAILARAMPAVRHDLAGPLSAMRMATTVLKRRFAAGDLAPAQAVERVEQFEAHLARLSDSAKRLRYWDLPARDESQPLATTTAQAVLLAQPLLALRGVELQVPGVDAPPLPASPTAAHSTLCLLLGAIYLLAEGPQQPPARITLQAMQDHAHRLRLQAVGQADASLRWPAPRTEPPLDAAALECLARHLGAGLQCGEGWVEIDAAPSLERDSQA